MLPFFAIALPVMILFCGLSVDAGLLELKKVQMQTAADAAALGAELEMERGTGSWAGTGQQDAALNGFADSLKNVTVTVTNPAQSGAYAGRYDAIQVTISQQVKTYFYGALTRQAATVSALAVSLAPPCGYFTRSSNSTAQGIVLAGTSFSSTCPVYADQGIGVDTFAMLRAPGVNVTGAASSSSLMGSVPYAPVYNVPPMGDPLAYLASPAFTGGCDHTTYTVSGGTAWLSPGTYCKGVTLSNCTVTLLPGLYVITGGANWNGATVKGAGVTLFFTTGGGAGYGQFLARDTAVNLSAPVDNSAGGIPALLFFGDRNWVASGPADFCFVGSSLSGDGVLYTSNTGIKFSGGGPIAGPNYLAIDTDNLYAESTSISLSSNFSGIPTGNPFRPAGGLVQ